MKKRILTEEMERDFFFVHDSIVYGALKKCTIPLTHPSYDDFKQIGLIKLVEAYESFPNELVSEEYIYQFTGYAYRKVYWGLLDQIRKEQRKHEKEEGLPEQYEQLIETGGSVIDEDFIFWELYQSMLSYLSPNEQAYLKDSVLSQLKVTEIAKKYQVSRKTVYEWKKRTAEKLQHFHAVLKN